MKKFFTYPVFVVLFLSFIVAMGFGAIVKYHYEGGKKYQFLQKPVMLISSTPYLFKTMISRKTGKGWGGWVEKMDKTVCQKFLQLISLIPLRYHSNFFLSKNLFFFL